MEANAIFAVAVIEDDINTVGPQVCSSEDCILKLFLGSARRTGYIGDIVIAIEADPAESTKAVLNQYNAVAYELPKNMCQRSPAGFFCGSEDERIPASVFRYYVYEKWLSHYSKESLVLLTDYRDIIFQSNPFTYRIQEWKDYSLQLFLGLHPNMLMSRSKEYRQLLMGCYGPETVRVRGSQIAVSAGAALGSRDGVLIWTHSMSNQLQEAPGRLQETRCSSHGIDKAFINYLVYNNKLRNLCRTKLYPHAEGAVNSLEGMHIGAIDKNFTGTLGSYWHIYKEEIGIVNWNGDLSPVVHQVHHFAEELIQVAKSKGLKVKSGGNEKDLVWQALPATKDLI